jgi:hypothetical protein
MSADIEKMTVMDGRIVQSRPKYAVEKGALSLTNAPFQAIASTQSQMTFNIYVPSENVFVDRKVQWSVGCYQQFSVQKVPTGGGDPTTAWVTNDAVIRPGYDFSLCAFPINSLCATLQATINDTTVILNSQDVLKEVLRLTDYKKNRLVRTSPTQLDKYASYNDCFGASNNPLGAYTDSADYDIVQNGAYPNLYFTDASGNVGGSYTATVGSATYAVATSSGIPVVTVGGTGASAGTALTVYIYWEATEPIVLSPFVFADHCEWDTGLFGINNIQLVANIQPASQLRTIRSTWAGGRLVVPGSLAFNTAVQGGVFKNPTLNVQFLTPSLDVPLPPKSVVPYMEFPRYISQPGQTLAPGASVQLMSQTITLPTIPDLLVIYVKPVGGYTIPGTGLSGQAGAPASDYQQGDWYLSLGSGTAGSTINSKPLSVNFDNFSGLLSSVTTQELYTMSVKNGLDMDWASWSGQGKGAQSSHTLPSVASSGANVSYLTRVPGQTDPLAGSILVLKPSQDITLQSGQAPSLVGNFTLQFNLTVYNQSDFAVTPQLYVITANSGFFESIRGSSRIIKGVLSEQDIISAPLASMTTRSELDRLVGAGAFHSLANVAHKAMDAYHKSKPEGAPAVGGRHHAEAMEGGRRSQGKSLNSRLM